MLITKEDDLPRMPYTEALLAVALVPAVLMSRANVARHSKVAVLMTASYTQVLSSRKNKHALFSSTATLVLGIMGSAVLIISGACALPSGALAHVHI